MASGFAILQANEFEQFIKLNPHLRFINRAQVTVSPPKGCTDETPKLKGPEKPRTERCDISI